MGRAKRTESKEEKAAREIREHSVAQIVEAGKKSIEVQEYPVRVLSKGDQKKLEDWLEVGCFPHVKILCPEFPEAFVASNGILAGCFRTIGLGGDALEKRLLRARHWDCVLDFIKSWYRKELDARLKSFTGGVGRGKCCLCVSV